MPSFALALSRKGVTKPRLATLRPLSASTRPEADFPGGLEIRLASLVIAAVPLGGS